MDKYLFGTCKATHSVTISHALIINTTYRRTQSIIGQFNVNVKIACEQTFCELPFFAFSGRTGIMRYEPVLHSLWVSEIELAVWFQTAAWISCSLVVREAGLLLLERRGLQGEHGEVDVILV